MVCGGPGDQSLIDGRHALDRSDMFDRGGLEGLHLFDSNGRRFGR